jgi:hypothetical protein
LEGVSRLDSPSRAPAYPVDRTHLARHDLDWLPRSLKAVRWTVAGTTWAAVAGGVVAGALFGRSLVIFYGKAVAAVLAGGYYLGDRAARAVTRMRLERLAHGSVDLARLRSAADGELLHVRGRVVAHDTLPGVLSGRPAVYRRVTFVVGNLRAIHEAAVDFELVDESGERIRVQVEGSRILAPEVERVRIDEKVVQALVDRSPDELLPAFARRRRIGRQNVRAGEFLVQHDDEVEIVGYKTRVLDPTVTERLARDAPMRATLRSGAALPLLVSPVARRR